MVVVTSNMGEQAEDWIKRETADLEDLEGKIKKLSEKWFKKSKTDNLIVFLQAVIRIKKQFIVEISNLEGKEIK